MICRIQELRYKDVIRTEDGARLGYVGDVELDTQNARLCSIVISGRFRWLPFGREEDLVVPWESIQVIGEDTVLVQVPTVVKRKKRPFFAQWAQREPSAAVDSIFEAEEEKSR